MSSAGNSTWMLEQRRAQVLLTDFPDRLLKVQGPCLGSSSSPLGLLCVYSSFGRQFKLLPSRSPP